MPSGGYRKPANPAPVSLPQSGRRTDGGAADKQPIRTPTGGGYGEAKALTEQQQAAPMAAGGPGPMGKGRPGGGGAAPPPQQGGAFGPTQRPNEPNDAGAQGQPMNPVAQNPQAFMRVLYSQFQHPAIERLVDFSARRDKPRP